MIKSMTGFGKRSVKYGDKNIVVEVKTLNSKQLDISLRTPSIYKEKDIEIRNMIKTYLDRGKVDMIIYFDNGDNQTTSSINSAIVTSYYNQALAIAASLGIEANKSDVFNNVLRFPETIKNREEEVDDGEWKILKSVIEETLVAVNDYRKNEGSVLITDILNRVELIKSLAMQVPQYESQRVPIIKQKLMDKMKDLMDVSKIDENRLEQELIYYLEKLDITEEKVRLNNHCKYFFETVETEDAPGRKLGFIAQEMGREINTMGSKANEHDIQKLVVRMKDELEKIKEQVLNIL